MNFNCYCKGTCSFYICLLYRADIGSFRSQYRIWLIKKLLSLSSFWKYEKVQLTCNSFRNCSNWFSYLSTRPLSSAICFDCRSLVPFFFWSWSINWSFSTRIKLVVAECLISSSFQNNCECFVKKWTMKKISYTFNNILNNLNDWHLCPKMLVSQKMLLADP